MALGTAAAVIGGSLVSGFLGSRSADRAADAQVQGSQAAIDFQRETRDLLLGISEPSRDISNQALAALSQIFGLPGPGFGRQPQGRGAGLTPQGAGILGRGFPGVGVAGRRPGFGPGFDLVGNAGQRTPQPGTQPRRFLPGDFNVNSLLDSPFFSTIRDETLGAVEQSAAARGGAASGNALRAIRDQSTGLVNNLLVNNLFRLAGVGTAANAQAAGGISSTGANVSSGLLAQGNARASGILGSGAAINNALLNIPESFLALQAAGRI